MQIKPRKSMLRLAPAAAGFTLAGILPLLVAAQAQALEFSFADDEVTGSLNSTASYGQLWRLKNQDSDNDSINDNDGNRNFDTGLVSQVFKLTSELTMQYQNYGGFMRGTALYDTELMNHNSDYNSNNDPAQPSQSYPHDSHFGNDAQDISGQDAKILDAYLWADWDVANMPLNVKAGKQVFNWGEALFVRDGINASNPVDAAAFRLPGAEVKEGLIPTEALGFNLGITDDLSVEGYYQWAWTETVQDPVGTYYSNDDLFAPGGNYAYENVPSLAAAMPLYASGFANGSGGLVGNNFIYPDASDIMRVTTIGNDLEARDGGQWGANVKYIVEELNSTEFGLYFLNYHTKEPVINANLGQYQGVDLTGLTTDLFFSPLPGIGGDFNASQAAAVGLATIDLAGNIKGQREYVEDVRLYGFSFSTTVGETSYFGEVAYRPNMPIGVTTSDDFLTDTLSQTVIIDTGGKAWVGGQQIGLGDSLSNYQRVEMFNYSLGSIQNWGPALGFNSLFTVGEIAGVSYRGDDLQYTGYVFDPSTGQYTVSNRYYSGAQNAEYVDVDNSRDNQINRNAYSYTLVAQGTWNDVFAGVNLSPNIAWKHDFEGNSHQAGSYVEGTKAYTLGLNASYQNTLEAEIAYTDFFGAGNDNGMRDRDNIGVNVKYSF